MLIKLLVKGREQFKSRCKGDKMVCNQLLRNYVIEDMLGRPKNKSYAQLQIGGFRKFVDQNEGIGVGPANIRS